MFSVVFWTIVIVLAMGSSEADEVEASDLLLRVW